MVLNEAKGGRSQDGAQVIPPGQENLRAAALNRQTQFLEDGKSYVWFVLLGHGEVEVADDDGAAGKVAYHFLEKNKTLAVSDFHLGAIGLVPLLVDTRHNVLRLEDGRVEEAAEGSSRVFVVEVCGKYHSVAVFQSLPSSLDNNHAHQQCME